MRNYRQCPSTTETSGLALRAIYGRRTDRPAPTPNYNADLTSAYAFHTLPRQVYHCLHFHQQFRPHQSGHDYC